jgi:aerobic-type carbon monoxide dehydrogenase small subunit (CoxS/CutS family)
MERQQLKVNGRSHEVLAPGLKPLASVLREDLGLIGTKTGCFEGRCGSCTVLVDGATVVSCIYPVALAEGKLITTIEGLSQGGQLNRVQQAMVDAHGMQCGICTPGVVMTLSWLLDNYPQASEAQIRASLAGNLCRCTGYQKIVDAALVACGKEES